MSLRIKKKSCDIISCASTESDSCGEASEEEISQKTNPLKHKTELCKNFSEKGACPYGKKCRFAHGAHELIHMQVSRCFRKKTCNSFWKNGFCPYGMRCQFSHQQIEWQTRAAMQAMQSIHAGEDLWAVSRLMGLLRGR